MRGAVFEAIAEHADRHSRQRSASFELHMSPWTREKCFGSRLLGYVTSLSTAQALRPEVIGSELQGV